MAKYRGTDTVWKRATASDFVTLATVPNIREVTPGLGGTNATFDQSAYGDVWMDFGAGQKEGDEVTMTLQYDPANTAHTNLKTDSDNGATMWIQAEHTPSNRKFRTTGTGLGARIIPDRTGSLGLEIHFKIVSPGVVESALP
jgi:hypothetical protein